MGGFLLFIFVVICGVIWWNFAQSKQADEAWAGAGRVLKLAFSPGSVMQSRTLLGRLGGNHVRVDTVRHGGKNSTTYTRYRISYPQPLRLGLRIEQEGFFGGITKALGAQDIATGDPAFDQVALVKGHQSQAVQRFLTPTRRALILKALFAHRGLEIGDQEITWECRGVASSQSGIEASVRSLCQLARSMWGDESPETVFLEQAVPPPWPVNRIEPAYAGPTPPPFPDHGTVQPPLLWNHSATLPIPPPLPPPEPLPPAITPVPEPAPSPPAQPAPAPPAPEPDQSAGPGLDMELVCSELFRDGVNSSDIDKIFASRFAGHRVTWQGTVRDCQYTSYDFVFGGKPCTRLTLELVTLGGDALGSRTVRAVAELPPEAREAMTGSIGTERTVAGELIKVDRLLRILFLKNAVIV